MPLTFAETPLYYRDSQGQYHRVLSGADMTDYRTAAAQDAIDAEARSKVFKNIEGTASGSIAASTNSSITVYISVPTGYRIFAINTIGFNGANSDYLALRGFTVLSSNNQVTIKMRSMATQSTISYTISVWVTCAKSDLF